METSWHNVICDCAEQEDGAKNLSAIVLPDCVFTTSERSITQE